MLANTMTGEAWKKHRQDREAVMKKRAEAEQKDPVSRPRTSAEIRQRQAEDGLELEMRRRNAEKLIAAGAVVTSSVAAYEIVGGVPARRIGWRFESESDRRKHDEMLAGQLLEPRFCEPLSVSWKSA